MLASITPLGERGRRSRWAVTITAFVVGAIATGVAAGAVVGALGGMAEADGLALRVRLAVLATALLTAVVIDAAAPRIPGPRRQVNPQWLDRYRGWVYGLGYGGQLGIAGATVVSSAAAYVAVIAAFLTGSPGAGALILGAFGAVRGLTPLLAAGVHTPRQLMELHAGMARWQLRTRWAAPAVLVGAFLISTLGSVA